MVYQIPNTNYDTVTATNILCPVTYRTEFESCVDIVLVFLYLLAEPHRLIILHRVDILTMTTHQVPVLHNSVIVPSAIRLQHGSFLEI